MKKRAKKGRNNRRRKKSVTRNKADKTYGEERLLSKATAAGAFASRGGVT